MRRTSSTESGEPVDSAKKPTKAKAAKATTSAKATAKRSAVETPADAEPKAQPAKGRASAAKVVDAEKPRSPAQAPRRRATKSASDGAASDGAASDGAGERVRERAYLLAEANGFAGDPSFYWAVAEQLVQREATR